MSYTTTVSLAHVGRLSSVPEHGSDVSGSSAVSAVSGGSSSSSSSWRRTRGEMLGGGVADRNSNLTRLTRTGAAIIARRNVFREQPWKAPSVQALSRQMGRSRDANPLLVEGPAGPVISAVGRQSDHHIASDVLGRAQERRVRAGIAMPRAGRPLAAEGAGQTQRRAGNSIMQPKSRLQQRPPRRPVQSFGAVFEHRDAFGKPKFIGRTDSTPEARFAQDVQQHQAVRNLISYDGGRSDVVWTGVGQYPLGPEEMSRITEKIVEERSKKLHAQKLRGPKPYSRHGF